MKLLYSLENGEIVIVVGKNEKALWDALPQNAIRPRMIEDKDIPTIREYREAWCDALAGSQIDICHKKAKEIALKKMKQQADYFIRELNIKSIEHINTPNKLLEINNVITEIRKTVLNLEQLDVTKDFTHNNIDMLYQIANLSSAEVLERIYVQIN